MSRRGLLRSLGRCSLGLVALLVAGGAAGVLPVSLSLVYTFGDFPIFVFYMVHVE